MDIPSHAQLVERIDGFLNRHNMKPTRLGRDVATDPNLVTTIRGGREPSIGLTRKLFAFMDELDAKLVAAEDVSNDIEATDSAGARAAHRLSAGGR